MRSPAAPAAAAVVLVALCGVSAYVGASMAPSDPPPAPVGPAPGTARIDELERDVGYLKERLQRASDDARAALDQVTDLRERLDAAAVAGPVAPLAGPEAPAGRRPAIPIDPEGVLTPEERAKALQAQADEDAKRFAPITMKFMFGLWSDTSKEGAESRKRQAWMEARALAQQLQCDGDVELALRDVLLAQYEQCARDLGPLVATYETTDFAAVERGLASIWSATDRRVAETVDAERFKTYEGRVGHQRRLTSEIFALEAKRNAPK